MQCSSHARSEDPLGSIWRAPLHVRHKKVWVSGLGFRSRFDF